MNQVPGRQRHPGGAVDARPGTKAAHTKPATSLSLAGSYLRPGTSTTPTTGTEKATMPMSPNCRAAQHKPSREHACSGCTCECHAVRPPTNFRDLVDKAREQKDTP